MIIKSEYDILASRIRSKKYKLTIGIPTFNRALSLIRTVNSLKVIQSKQDVFIEISDNTEGDIDITEIICFFEQNKDFDFIYLKNKKNLGAASNFNQIFGLSPSNKTMMLFDDDELRTEINQVIETELIDSSETLYFYNDFRYENPKTVSPIKRLKNHFRNHLNIFAKREFFLTHESLLFTVPSFIGAIYHTEDFKKNQLTENHGPTGDYFFTMKISKIRSIRRIKLKLINYYHGNNDSSNIETYTQFPQKNYEYRLNYVNELKIVNLKTKKTIKKWENNIHKLFIAESKDTTSKFAYINSRLYQLKTIIKYYLNHI
jgi:hypothetical protein